MGSTTCVIVHHNRWSEIYVCFMDAPISPWGLETVCCIISHVKCLNRVVVVKNIFCGLMTCMEDDEESD